jgi:hypothetical protein
MVKNPHAFHNGAWQSRFVPQSRLILERMYYSAMTGAQRYLWGGGGGQDQPTVEPRVLHGFRCSSLLVRSPAIPGAGRCNTLPPSPTRDAVAHG